MRRRIRTLIAICILVSAALGWIQYYFIHNTYMLYQKQSISEIKDALMLMEQNMQLDMLRSDLINKIQERILSHEKNEVTKRPMNFTDLVLSQRSTYLIASNRLLQEHEVQYIVAIKNLFIKFSDDTVANIAGSDQFWFGNASSSEGQYGLTNYTLTRTLKSNTGLPVLCELQTESSFTVLNWNSVLIKKLSGLILFSCLLVLGVITLFYITIRNFIKQKKIAGLKTDFVNNITHEFNTPLATLEVAITTLERLNTNFNADSSFALSTIARQSKRLQSLVRQAVEFSKPGEEMEIQVAPINSNELIDNILLDFKQSHEEIVIDREQKHGNVILVGDPVLLTTVINAILDNAVKYGGNKLSIQTAINEAFFSISITDNGKGIPAKQLKMIFDKFYRIQNDDTHNTKGLGLGLYYAQQIVKAHYGKIEVNSKIGEGSTFTILIPLK